MNLIPDITDPLGKYWEQPGDIQEAPIDDTHVLLRPDQMKDLHDYSSTIPTGVYNGKCWKRHDIKGWLLCWFGNSDLPSQCSINFRQILVVT